MRVYIDIYTGNSRELLRRNCRLPVDHIWTHKNYSIKKPNLKTLTLKTKGEHTFIIFYLYFWKHANSQTSKTFLTLRVFFDFSTPKRFKTWAFQLFGPKHMLFKLQREEPAAQC